MNKPVAEKPKDVLLDGKLIENNTTIDIFKTELQFTVNNAVIEQK